MIFSSLASEAEADTDYDNAISQCNISFPNLIYDYWSRSSCIDEADKQKALRDAERVANSKEDAARPCIAAQLPELEKKLSHL